MLSFDMIGEVSFDTGFVVAWRIGADELRFLAAFVLQMLVQPFSPLVAFVTTRTGMPKL